MNCSESAGKLPISPLGHLILNSVFFSKSVFIIVIDVLSLFISEVNVKYAQVATATAPSILIIFLKGSATSVFSLTLGIYFSELSQTARLPVIAPVTTDIKLACCVVRSGCDNAHSMHLMYTPVMHSIINRGSIFNSNSFLATSSALIQTIPSAKQPKRPSRQSYWL